MRIVAAKAAPLRFTRRTGAASVIIQEEPFLACAEIFCHIAAMKREFSVIIERDAEGYYVAQVPELKGCHTQARSLDELQPRIREAIELCLEVVASQ